MAFLFGGSCSNCSVESERRALFKMEPKAAEIGTPFRKSSHPEIIPDFAKGLPHLVVALFGVFRDTPSQCCFACSGIQALFEQSWSTAIPWMSLSILPVFWHFFGRKGTQQNRHEKTSRCRGPFISKTKRTFRIPACQVCFRVSRGGF